MKVWGSWFSRGSVSQHPLQAFSLGSGDLLAIFGVPWLTETSFLSLLSVSHRVLPVDTSVSKFPPLKRLPVILAQYPFS